MNTKNDKKPPLLIEGELLLEKGKSIVGAEVNIRILDVTRIDAKSVVLAESIEVQSVKKNQINIPFQIFGPAPDPSKSYIVVASISIEKENRDRRTLYRTTESIPVFRDGYPEIVKIPLTEND